MALFSKNKRPMCAAVIVAAGSSQRMGGEDKQLLQLNGKPVLAYSLETFEYCGLIGEIIVVTREDCIERVQEICAECGISKAAKIVPGGQTRTDSVMNGVFAATGKHRLIAIHDGARPCVTAEIIENAINAVTKAIHAAAPAVSVSSTIKKAQKGMVIETVDRGNLFEIQTPQVFTAEIIKGALTNAKNKAIPVTDDCMAVEQLGVPVRLTEGSRNNIKITTREDIVIAEAILKSGGRA